jgi:hypothetical protein
MSMKKAPLESELSKSALFLAFFLFVELASCAVKKNFFRLAFENLANPQFWKSAERLSCFGENTGFTP